MDETDVAAAYRELTGRVEPPAPDVGAIRARVRRRRARRRRLTVGAAALGVVLVAGVAVEAARRVPDPTPAAPPTPATSAPATDASPGWQRVASPLSPRTESLVVPLGGEVLFLGGATKDLCPPTASCVMPETYARDGALYDPATGTWRELPDAPVPIADYQPHAVADGRLTVVTDDGVWRSYDTASQAWSVLPDPPTRLRYPTLTALEGSLYAVGTRGPVAVLDLDAGTWTDLPSAPTTPALTDRTVTATPEGVVVIGVDATARNDGSEPAYLLADVWDGTSWRRLPATGQLANAAPWTWTGGRLLVADPTCADGGQVDPYPSCLPYGGTLDPATGAWSPLRDVPDLTRTRGGWSVVATADGSPLAAAYGYVHDDTDGTWTRLPRPEDAPEEPGGATWAGGRLLVLGGVTWARGDARLSSDLWVWSS